MAMKNQGAYDYLEKPFKLDEAEPLHPTRLLSYNEAISENLYLRKKRAQKEIPIQPASIGTSPKNAGECSRM